MGFYDAIRVGASGAVDSEYTIARSLRFDDGSSTDLSRTPSSTGNQKVWTFSAWIKLANTDAGPNYIYSAHSGSDYFALYFRYNQLYTYFSPGNNYGSISGRKFRDVGAWFHLVHQVDALNTTQKIWINGTELSLNSSRNPGNSNYPMNESGVTMKVGNATWRDDNIDSYMAEIHHSDGNKYEASDFGETDATTGQWIAKSPSITYGTNGFYLNFSDNSGTTATTLGKDSSGNGNNFTPNNFSVSAGAGNDSVEDTPTNNWCTLNPLAMRTNGNVTPSNGNLDASFGSSSGGIAGTFAVSSGKWYWEITITATSSARIDIGVIDDTFETYNGTHRYNPGIDSKSYAYTSLGTKYNNNTDTSYGATYTTNDVIAIALDLDNGTITFYKNNVSQGQAFSGLTGGFLPGVGDGNSSGTHSISANFGQRAFAYTPPTDFKALNSANLPDPTILLPNKHFDTLLYTGNGSSQTLSGLNFAPDWVWIKIRSQSYDHAVFDTVRGATKDLEPNQTGAEQTRQMLTAFTSDGFSVGNDSQANQSGDTYVAWNWNAGDTDGKTYTVKVVSDSGNKYRFDDFGTSAVTLDLAEGGTYIFDQSDSSNSGHPLRFSTTSDGTHGSGSEYTTGVTTSGTPGSSGAFTKIVVAASAPTLYYYCTNHSGMGGAINTNSTLGSSNFDGTIQSTVKVNATAGFSIITYTGNGSNGSTIGHGLGVTPNHVIWKERSGAENWINWQTQLGDNSLLLNLTNAQISASGNALFIYGDFNSTSLKLGNADQTNRNGDTYVTYCFSEVAGYSKFGSVNTNGSTDNAFIYLGFRAKFIMFKRSDGSGNWTMWDTSRNTFNVMDKYLFANSSGSEGTDSQFDILSNGIKLRTSGYVNGGTYIYFAFAESPFKNARAR